VATSKSMPVAIETADPDSLRGKGGAKLAIKKVVVNSPRRQERPPGASDNQVIAQFISLGLSGAERKVWARSAFLVSPW
jgi:hypothetical protein